MKAKIFLAAKKLFGEYGFHGTTTRMIAQEVGIDISTMHYHWGDKRDLYEAVILDLNERIQYKLNEVEKNVKGESLDIRLEVSIEEMCEYLFSNPCISNLILFRSFTKTREDSSIDKKVPEYISNIAVAMGLAIDKQNITVEAKARVLAVVNAILNFISGENFFREMLDITHEEYVRVVKDTLKFILIPAFSKDKIKN
ncbi:MAG: TetR/AcrR family transcriptional regulator [Desulfobacterales bacterium]|nr:TetR/AcrR family transcriptional regulator [Desulfobacterales bacterium]MBF0396522.1 TetR/AcrR family transcriptional regulator [Desulfobacterales bacterium]